MSKNSGTYNRIMNCYLFSKKKRWGSSTTCPLQPSVTLYNIFLQMFIFTSRYWGDSRNVILLGHTPFRDSPVSGSRQEQTWWVAQWERAQDRKTSLTTEVSSAGLLQQTLCPWRWHVGISEHIPKKQTAKMKCPEWVTFHRLSPPTLDFYRALECGRKLLPLRFREDTLEIKN